MPRVLGPVAFMVVLVVAFVGSAAALLPDEPTGAGDRDVPLVVGDRTRHYLLHVPPDLARRSAMPVIIALHAGGSSATQFKRYAGFDRLADRHGFVVAYPDGSGRALRSWNAGDCCGAAKERGLDDVGFIEAVLHDLARQLPVDHTRVYATGHSNGAMMAHRLAAEIPERIAAIAAVAGAMALDHFAPGRPVPILHIHSVDDPRELYGEPVGPPFPVTTPRAHDHPVEFELARWVDRDSCPAQGHVAERRAKPASARRVAQTATRVIYAPCATAAEVELWKLTGAGHVWPGADTQTEPALGQDTDLIDAAGEAWRFFERFTRPDAPPL